MARTRRAPAPHSRAALALCPHSAAALPIFNGSAPPTAGEAVDSVYLYKNGGVGALGQMGVREAAVRPERWAWIVVTRSGNDLITYVNGRGARTRHAHARS